VVALDRAVLAVDLGEDTQVAVLMDHERRILARRCVAVKAYGLGGLLGWAAQAAVAGGFVGVVVACEPTGYRWRTLMELADAAGMGFVCVQPLRVHRAREEDDYTRDKTDHKDAVLIGTLTLRLDCYLPERATAHWARLRHLGQRRFDLVGEVVATGRQLLDLLACCWPAMLGCAAKPLVTTTWLACLSATVEHCGGDPAQLRRLGRDEFAALVRPHLARFGARKLSHRIVDRCHMALADPHGVVTQRPGGLERIGLLLEDWGTAHARLSDVERRMVGVLDAMGLTGLVTSIPGVSAVTAAAILAETGDLSRFASARSVVKHAGLNPAENTSATLRGATRLSRRGRPRLRVAAWRAVWAAKPHNPVLAARFARLTTRDRGRLSDAQARVACAASLLRWLHAIITTGQPFSPDIATGNANRRSRKLQLAA
jgi:transposase